MNDDAALTERVIAAAIEVHRVLGPGLGEDTYEAALCLELGARGIAFVRQVPVWIEYRGQRVGEGRVDLLIEGALVVELKAAAAILPIHFAQTLSYLKMTDLPLGLLINFNVKVLHQGVKRVIWTR